MQNYNYPEKRKTRALLVVVQHIYLRIRALVERAEFVLLPND